MRIVDTSEIYAALEKMIPQTLCGIDGDTRRALDGCRSRETSPAARWALDILQKNFDTATEKNIPYCQDTGMAVVYLEIGQSVSLTGEYIEDAVNRAVRVSYGRFRKSVLHPLSRVNTGDNTPAVIHTKITAGDKVKIKFMAKGFGSENQSRIYMLTPSDWREGIIAAAVDAVKKAGGLPCPPIMLGIGIGGTMEKCAELSKEALLRKTGEPHPDQVTAALETEILERVNALGIGAQGLGGGSTCFAVHIETYPTHIAGFPVAINIQCHAVRHAETEI